jgi:hypothetical protein
LDTRSPTYQPTANILAVKITKVRGKELTFGNQEKQLSVVGSQLPELSNLIRIAADPKELTTDLGTISAVGTAEDKPAMQRRKNVIREVILTSRTVFLG